MSREIKFRVWFYKKKTMHNVCSIDFSSNEVEFHDNDWIGWHRFDEVELMQYTGLKDKNGVKIFEGDIVKCKVYSLDNEKWEIDDIGKVVYDDDCCAYFIQFNEGYIHLTSAWNLEVIGNVWEHEHLLGDNNE